MALSVACKGGGQDELQSNSCKTAESEEVSTGTLSWRAKLKQFTSNVRLSKSKRKPTLKQRLLFRFGGGRLKRSVSLRDDEGTGDRVYLESQRRGSAQDSSEGRSNKGRRSSRIRHSFSLRNLVKREGSSVASLTNIVDRVSITDNLNDSEVKTIEYPNYVGGYLQKCSYDDIVCSSSSYGIQDQRHLLPRQRGHVPTHESNLHDSGISLNTNRRNRLHGQSTTPDTPSISSSTWSYSVLKGLPSPHTPVTITTLDADIERTRAASGPSALMRPTSLALSPTSTSGSRFLNKGTSPMSPMGYRLQPTLVNRNSATLGCTREWRSEQEQVMRDQAHLSSTWPPSVSSYDLQYLCASSGVEYQQELLEFTNTDACFDDTLHAAKEWLIPFSDLEFGKCLKRGEKLSIYRGKWHGDVLIQTRKVNTDTQRKDFLDEISVLSMIRHENIALFMGACIEPKQVAVVTSVRKGSSLYHHIHIRGDRFSLHAKIQIARQIAHAMGYLHHKGIVLRKLCSKNVYLEVKVKVSIMDNSIVESQQDIYKKTGSLPKGHLTYLAPELMRTLRVNPPHLTTHGEYTVKTDIYAFGTVLYELLSSQWPYSNSNYCTEAVVYLLSKGQSQKVQHIRCPPHLRLLVEDCWKEDPEKRPNFADILVQLENSKKVTRRQKRCRSVPDIVRILNN